MRLQNKVAVVTGAASGIGKGIAELFAQEGARVVAVDVNTPGVEVTAQNCRDCGRDALALTVDIGDPDDAGRMASAALERYGRIDILVNSAALDQRVVPIAEMDVALWDRLLSVNARGTFLCCRAVLPSMIAARSGSIVNIASDLGYIVAPGLGAYCASKGAVLQLTRVIAAENGPYNIRANAVCPTMIDTPMARRTIDTHPRADAWVAELEQEIPLRRIGRVDDVAGVALFLASDEAAYVTGVCLPVDGGRTVL